MDEAARAALDSEYAALNARCAASSREAARVAATLRALPHAFKVDWLFNSAVKNNAALVRLLLADGLSPDSVDTLERQNAPFDGSQLARDPPAGGVGQVALRAPLLASRQS
jgi:hypothetical protein